MTETCEIGPQCQHEVRGTNIEGERCLFRCLHEQGHDGPHEYATHRIQSLDAHPAMSSTETRCPVCGGPMDSDFICCDNCSVADVLFAPRWRSSSSLSNCIARSEPRDAMSEPPALPSLGGSAPRQQEHDEGWTKKGQQQEPEPSRDALSPLTAQDLAWMDEWAARCRTPYAEMSPDEGRRVTAYAAMWFVPALNEVHRLRAAIRYYADQRRRYPRSCAEIHAFGRLLAAIGEADSLAGASVPAVDPSRSTPDATLPSEGARP